MTQTSLPYAEFVAGRDPMELLQQTPRRISDLAQEIGEANLDLPWAPGKWSGRFILAHLADCEIAFGFRWRQAVASPSVVIQPFDQDAWATGYDSLKAKWALGAFVTARLWNIEFLKTVPEEAFSKPVIHPERGELTLKLLLQITAGHDINHLRQLEAIRAANASS
jgi:hypothetical protein